MYWPMAGTPKAKVCGKITVGGAEDETIRRFFSKLAWDPSVKICSKMAVVGENKMLCEPGKKGHDV